jgi:hypothetical protein
MEKLIKKSTTSDHKNHKSISRDLHIMSHVHKLQHIVDVCKLSTS